MLFSPGCTCCGGIVMGCPCQSQTLPTMTVSLYAYMNCLHASFGGASAQCLVLFSFTIIFDSNTGCWNWTGAGSLGLINRGGGNYTPYLISGLTLCCVLLEGIKTWELTVVGEGGALVLLPLLTQGCGSVIFLDTIGSTGPQIGTGNYDADTPTVVASWDCSFAQCNVYLMPPEIDPDYVLSLGAIITE